MPPRSRSERRERARGTRRRLYVLIALGVVVVVIAAAAAVVGVAGRTAEAEPVTADVGALAAVETTEAASIDATASPAVLVEMPDVTGAPLDEAELLLGVAGFEIRLISTPPGEAATGTVLAQAPAPGERVPAGTVVEVVWADPAATTAGSLSAATSSTGRSADRLVVCLDPGHQASANTSPEPVGPGASTTKAKVTGGATGVVTKQAEHALTLAVALKVKERLEGRGIAVVMTRTAADVDISNSQRAAVASDAGADLFVRIHADSSTNADLKGVATLYPSGNEWVAPIEAPSLDAARVLHAAVLAATGAVDRGIVKRADLSGFNWSTVPSVLVEMGFLSNPAEDRQLADSAYQDALAAGIAEGIVTYLGR